MQNSVGSRAFQNARLQKQFRKQAEVLLQAAIAAYRQGKQRDAQALCRQILKDLPEHFDALHLLGVCESDLRQFEEAARILTRAVSVAPRSAEAHSNLGLALFNLKRYDDARKCQERAVALQPNFPTAWTNLGNVLMLSRLLEQAVAAHDRAIQLKPDYGDAYCNRGMALLLLNRCDQADQSFDRALSFQRRHLPSMIGKGMVSLRLRHDDAAQAAFNAVLAIKPDFAEVLTHRGRVHQQMGRLVQAEADFDAALAIDPVMEGAWRGKAAVRILSGDIAQGIAACMKALEQDPASEITIAMLGGCYAQQGDIAGAIAHFDRALAIKPDYEEAIVKKIFALDFAPDTDFAVHQAVRREWWDRIGVPIPQRELRRPMPDPNKRIVVGYVSSDFRSHSAAFCFMPVLQNHDRRAFQVICYSCWPVRDAVTEKCQSLADVWVEASQFSDDELADRIQSDGVDILVDLSGHTGGNRLTVFARKPAPIQVTAWGAGTGTGLQTMDYFFADPVTIPETVRHLFAEKVYDLPCVITTEALPDVQPSPLPMIRNGHVTFGVFNRIDKISDDALAMWSKLLRDIAGSTIVVKNAADQFLRDGLIGRFVAQGGSPDRIRCIGQTSRAEHLAEFANVDISLDPFPLNGGVSTWESLQAGVPVVTKLGWSAPSRLGGAIVKAVGLDDWVAEDDNGYHEIARTYASMASHLEALRAELPARVAASAAGNGAIYTRRVEEGYRQFWRDYCAAVSQPADRKQAEVLLAAAAAYRQGKHSDTQTLCRQILKDLPEHFEALHLLGVSEADCRQFEDAERTLARAVSVAPRSAEAHSNLGLALFNLKRFDDARKCQERAVALQPNFPTAWTNLGNALMRLELPEQAVAAHDRAIQLKPDYGDAYCNRGMALLLLNRCDQADQSFDRALSFQRRHLPAMIGKGIVSLRLRHDDAALAVFNAVLAIKPDSADVLTCRGGAYQQMGQLVQAEADFDAALAIDPVMEGAWRGKAEVRILLGDIAQGIAACMKALEQNPASEITITMLGGCYARQGDIAGAIAHFDRALAIKPDYEKAIMKKIFALDFAPDTDFAVHQAVRREWWDRIGVPIRQRELRRPMPDPNKRIVVGYVSSDFRTHSAAFAFMPVLQNHDRQAFEIICYSCSPVRDAVTEECQSLADVWVDACQFSDDELADRIQSDGVDILVDLSGHTGGNRLTVFARKPAPIQVTAWGAGTGTGLQTMDYFFADPVTIPETVRHLFAEKVYDLPCVITMDALPDVQPSPLPMIRKGHVTFGVFNRIDKISDDALAMWSKLLRDIPGSTIVVKNAADQFLRDGLTGRFVAHGVAPDRVRCIGQTSRAEHLAEFANIDISLDPFPLNGGVSTWESLQAGVPVVTKLGGSAPARLGGAIVKAVGLDDWVAEDDNGYHEIARTYASMASHLEALRAELPARVAASAAGNGEIYTRRVEEGYRQFWRDYCAAVSQPADGTPD